MDKYEEFIAVMKVIRNIGESPDIDICWSKYDDLAELFKEIDFYIERLGKRDDDFWIVVDI